MCISLSQPSHLIKVLDSGLISDLHLIQRILFAIGENRHDVHRIYLTRTLFTQAGSFAVPNQTNRVDYGRKKMKNKRNNRSRFVLIGLRNTYDKENVIKDIKT